MKLLNVLVYPVPPRLYQQDDHGSWMSRMEDCSQYGEMYNAELLLPQLFETRATKKDPHYYFIPAMPACHYHRCLVSGDSPLVCQQATVVYLQRIVDWVDSHYPPNNRTLVAITLDRAIQFFETNTRLHKRLTQMIILQHDGSDNYSPLTGYRPGHDITIPTYRDYSVIPMLFDVKNTTAYFRGTFKPDQPLYGHGYRHALLNLKDKHPDLFLVAQGHSPSYWQELASSKWALCPEGWVPWSPRFYDALQVGTMPIILSGRWRPAVDMEFPRVELSEMEQLVEMVKGTPAEIPDKVRNSVRWNLPAKPGDAFHRLMEQLAKLL